MKTPWIKNYEGTWVDDEGHTLVIKTIDEKNATADLMLNGHPIHRAWCENKPSMEMNATYDFKEGSGLNIDLGYSGFILSVTHIFDNPLTPDAEESLAIGICQFADDVELDQYHKVLGQFGYFKRYEAEPEH